MRQGVHRRQGVGTRRGAGTCQGTGNRQGAVGRRGVTRRREVARRRRVARRRGVVLWLPRFRTAGLANAIVFVGLLLTAQGAATQANGQEAEPAVGEQGVLLEARTEVILPSPQNPVFVRSTFLLQTGPQALTIPLSVLVPEPARMNSLQAWLDGRAIPVVLGDDRTGEMEVGTLGASPSIWLREVRGHYWEGAVALGEGAVRSSDSLSLEISFMVEEAWVEDRKVILPLVVPRWVPDPPTPRTFLAAVSVPEGFTITGSFPTSVLERPEPGSEERYRIGLQGVPAMLVLRTAFGAGPLLTLERGLDLFVVLILLAMGLAGLRYLRRRER